MEKVKCRECKRALVLEEENLCVYCELTQESTVEIAVIISCGVCKVSVEEDNEGLFCYVCNSWFHNNCNETPLDYELYALLHDAPSNVKWFCDKCTWETEKWIKVVEKKQCEASAVIRKKKRINKLKKGETNKEEHDEEYVLLNIKDKAVLCGEDNEEMNIEHDGDVYREIKVEVHDQDDEELYERDDKNILEEDNKDHIPVKPENENEEFKNEDSDGWDLSKEEIKKGKRKKKWKINPKEITITENLAAENILSILDISPERLPSITDGIIYVKSSNSKHIRSKCNLCPKHFKHPEVCIAHKLVVHEGVQTPYKCSIS